MGGGSKGGDSYDAAYNARMATVAEAVQGMSEENFDFYKEFYQPMEKQQIASNIEMIPIETGAQKEQIASQSSLLPGQTALTKAQNESALSLLPAQTEFAKTQMADATTGLAEKAPVRNAFFNESLTGVDVKGRTDRAGADAAHSFANSMDVMKQNAARMGVNPSSGQFGSMLNTNALNRSKTIAGARTSARTQAENEKYTRLTNAMGY